MLTLHLLILYFLILMHSIYLFTFIAWIKYTKCLSEHSPIILQPLFAVKSLENTSIMILQCSLLNFSPFNNKHYQYLVLSYPLILWCLRLIWVLVDLATIFVINCQHGYYKYYNARNPPLYHIIISFSVKGFSVE